MLYKEFTRFNARTKTKHFIPTNAKLVSFDVTRMFLKKHLLKYVYHILKNSYKRKTNND